MGRIVVQFPGYARVLVDGEARGDTNRVLRLRPGEHTVELEGEETHPERHVVTVEADADLDEIVRVGFGHAKEAMDRFSPLYCRYNGCLLGQFLSLSFSEYGRDQYAERRMRMLEFLQEISVEMALPQEPPPLGGEAHGALFMDVMPKLLERSKELGEFVLLGVLLTHHGLLAESDPETSRDTWEQIERIRKDYDLPPIESERFVAAGHTRRADDVLSPSLAYLGEVVDRLEVESDTAFVIMPFKPPYSTYFSTLYRPSLEEAGFRSFRAWGGLSNEDYCDLLIKLIEKSGMVWADVSELNYNVLYEIGAAHALDKLSMLVVREDLADDIPANIGHDGIVKYSPDADDWPEGTVLLMAALISSLKVAAERGERLRVGSERVKESLERVGHMLKEILVPPEAREAARRGCQKYGEGDYDGARELFDEAIRLGLDDAVTMFGRGSTLLSQGMYQEAEADLTQAVDVEEDTTFTRPQQSLARLFRGMARESQDKYADALEDYTAAIRLGYGEADVYQRRAWVLVERGELGKAREDVEKAREIAPDDAQTLSCQGDLLLAEKRYDDAIEQFDKALAAAPGQPNAGVEFPRALALLLSGRLDDALDGYRKCLAHATPDQLDWARRQLERRAEGHRDLAKCRKVLGEGSGQAG